MSKIVGSRGSNHLKGGGSDDKLLGLGGGDVLQGKHGNDEVFGHAGNDRLSGGLGDDFLKGGGGRDKLKGNAGSDVLEGGAKNDKLIGGGGDDVLEGDGGRDKLYGGKDDDTLKGGNGNDHLTGGSGNDSLYGGRGFDSAYFSGNLADYDIVSVAGGLQITHARGSQADGVDFLATDVDALVFADQTIVISTQGIAGGSGGTGGTGGGTGGTGNGTGGTGDSVNEAPALVAGADIELNLADFLGVIIDPTITITDPDDATMVGATVSITSGLNPGDILSFVDQNGITGSYNAVSGVLTLTGTATTALYEIALESVQFGTSLLDVGDVVLGQREITFRVSDGEMTSAVTSSSKALIEVTLDLSGLSGGPMPGGGGGGAIPNVVPVLTAGDTTGLDLADLSSVTVDPTITITDSDDTEMDGATVSIGAGFNTGDLLSFVDQNGITGSYDSGTGVLTLTGTASIATYEAALGSVTFGSSLDAVDVVLGERTITFTVSDGEATSAANAGAEALVDVSLTIPNVAPVLTAGDTTGLDLADLSSVTIDPTITITDSDDTEMDGATVSISAGFNTGDLLSFVDQNGITGSYDSGTGVLTLTGTASIATYEAALGSVTFGSSLDAVDVVLGERTITFTVSDGEATSAANAGAESLVDVSLTIPNVAPVLTAGDTTGLDLADLSSVTIDPTITITDSDDTEMDGATVSISAGFNTGDLLSFVDQNGITGSYDSGTGVLTLTGTASIATYEAALGSVTFGSSLDAVDVVLGERTITFTVSDGEATSAANAGAESLVDVSLTIPNVAPVLTAGDTVDLNLANLLSVTIDPTISITDSDDTEMEGATIAIVSGFNTGDQLVFANQNGITGSYSSGSGVLTLSGTASIATYEAALESIQYGTSLLNVLDVVLGEREISFQVNDGDVDSAVTANAKAFIDVTLVPDILGGGGGLGL